MDKKTFQNLKNNSKNRLPRLVVRRGWSLFVWSTRRNFNISTSKRKELFLLKDA